MGLVCPDTPRLMTALATDDCFGDSAAGYVVRATGTENMDTCNGSPRATQQADRPIVNSHGASASVHTPLRWFNIDEDPTVGYSMCVMGADNKDIRHGVPLSDGWINLHCVSSNRPFGENLGVNDSATTSAATAAITRELLQEPPHCAESGDTNLSVEGWQAYRDPISAALWMIV